MRNNEQSGNMSRDETVSFSFSRGRDKYVLDCLSEIYSALSEKGYNAVNQIVGYLMSGDPIYITSHKGARKLVLTFSREEILDVIVRYCLR